MGLSKALTELSIVESVHSTGEAGARVRTHMGLKVDLRIVAPDQFGNLLQHFTGSREHNMALREAAVRKGLHVSEYGITDDKTGKTHKCATEEQVYKRLGYRYIEPELRENRGELAAAAKGGPGLPELVGYDDLRGDLHCHTTASDGRNSIEEMALAALERGYEYLAITDHSATHGFGDDVSPDQLKRQIELVHEANEKIDGIELLAGTEVNILPDGAPDYEDDLLAELDWVIASVHTSFRMGAKEMTKRMVAAIEHPADRRDRPPDRAQAAPARPLRGGRGEADRGGRAHGHVPGDQRQPRPARSQRHLRARRGGGRRDDRGGL